jgi:predicted RNase H-like nuclease
MSKRLQVILEDREMREIRRIAKEQQMTVAEWVRRALRAARSQAPLRDTRTKLEAIRAATVHAFPTADIGQMLGEIEKGYVENQSR